MSDLPLSEADKIRNKRLAKLGSQSRQPSEASAPKPTSNEDGPKAPDESRSTGNAQPAITSTPKINISKDKPGSNPFAQLGSKPAATTRSSESPVAAAATSPSRHRPKSRSVDQSSKTSIENFEQDTLRSVFRFTLDPSKTRDVHGHAFHYLSGVRSDLEEANTPLRLTLDVLGDCIQEAASDPATGTTFQYLLSCWKRAQRSWRDSKLKGFDEARSNIIKEARRMCMSYCIFAITMPEMFGAEEHMGNPLPKHLLEAADSEQGIDHEFLVEAVSRFEEDSSIKEALVEAMEQLSKDLARKTMNDDYKPYVLALRSYARFPPLLTALAESPNFAPAATVAQEIEKKTTLGPFFRISPVQPAVALNYFSSPKTRDRGNVLNAQNALRMTLQTHQNELFDVVTHFVKASKDSRERTLDWLAMCVNKNHKRRAMRPDERLISSDGFMINVTVCLDMLSEPFMDASFSKINRIEADYFRRSPRVQIEDETKLNADGPTADAFYANKVEGTSTFISEIFFLTVAAHHYGTESTHSRMTTLRRELKHADAELARLERDRDKYVSMPAILARFDAIFKNYKDKAEAGHCSYMALEGVVLDELSQSRSMSFMRYVIVWLLRLVSGADFPKTKFTLPLPAGQPEVFKCLPEYFLEDIVDHFKFVTRAMPHVISPTQCDELVMICITFLRSSEYVKNPYLKSGLVTILYYGVLPTRNHAKGELGDVLNALPFALKHLLHSLMQFYIECETTGTHTQFYDKFNIRYEIFQVIKCIWSNVVYRENLETEAAVNVDFFVRFVNLLLNDVTFVLDESFTSFNKITNLSRELRDDGDTMEEAVRKDKEEALEEAKGKAKSYMSLTNESVATLKLFTDALADSFTTPEVVQRLADMLDYNLESLVGPKQRDLRVDNPEEYNFNAKALLADIIDVYLNLSKKTSFHVAIARDGRSYKPANFEAAAKILLHHALKSSEEIARWRKLAASVEAAKAEDEVDEEDLGDAPEEFYDPLMATIMNDPVILPISRTVIDRSTIRQHLLSDPHDPFNRTPLRIEDVIANDELKGKIEAFKNEKKAARKKDVIVTDDDDGDDGATTSKPEKMDTTP